MNQKKLLIAALVIFFASDLFSQTFSLSFKTGYGKYSMEEVKEFQEKVLNTYLAAGLEAENVDEFPGFVNFEGHAQLIFANETSVGLFGGFYSTGGRTVLSDYSGSILDDYKLSAFSIGGTVNIALLYNFYFSAQLSLMYSKLNLLEKVTVFDNAQSQDLNLNSFGYGIEPGLFYQINYNPLLFRLGASYYFGTSGEFELNDREIGLKPDWSGFRLWLSAGFVLGSNE